jgi:site-specific DNA recombinase
MSTAVVALYARVSSEKQAQTQTIDSQLTALRDRISADGERLLAQYEFIDRGYSGTTLIRPALERLRDAVANGEIERLYVPSPDRLARRYAYQVMLVDECQRAGVTLVFLNCPLGKSPEDELLLQVQGMIAEYERAKVLERSRRGKRHRAQQGSVSVMSRAPYGYQYITVAEGAGHARYEVDVEKAQVVRQIYDWVGRERRSLSEVCRLLADEGISSPAGKAQWDRVTVWNVLKNPAYCGEAAYGRTRIVEPRPRQVSRPGKMLSLPMARPEFNVPTGEWLSIPVPALVDKELFELVQAQLEENRQRLRSRQKPATRLLQGLLVCGCCGYAYCGASGAGGRPVEYSYYRCATNNHAHRGVGQKLCWNKSVRSDELEQAVWSQVCLLLQDPQRLANEYQRRLNAVQVPAETADVKLLEQ